MALLALLVQFSAQSIEKDGRIQGAWFEDVDADGRLDLVIQVGRRLDVHLGSSSKPSRSLLMDERPFVWTLCRLDDAPGLRVAVFGAAGVFAARDWEGEPVPLVVHPNLFQGTLGLREAPARLDFMPRLNADEASDLLFFGPDVTFLMLQREGRFDVVQKVLMPMDSTGRMGWWPNPDLTETVRVPWTAAADLDGDGRTDLAYFQDPSLFGYLQTADGGFPYRPDRTVKLIKKKATGLLDIQKPPELADLDGDRQSDIIHVNVRSGAAEVFYGSASDVEQREDEGTWGLSAQAPVMDRDGRRCLILRTVEPIGVLDVMDLLKERRSEMRVSFYPIDAQGRPARTAAQHLRVTLPFVAEVSQHTVELRRIFEPIVADLDGDGRRDYVVLTADRRLARYPGRADGSVEADPVAVEGFSAPENASEVTLTAADVNGDRRDDVLVRIRVDGGNDRVVLLISK